MDFIDMFMGNALVWVLIFCVIADAIIFALLVWMIYQDWRWRK